MEKVCLTGFVAPYDDWTPTQVHVDIPQITIISYLDSAQAHGYEYIAAVGPPRGPQVGSPSESGLWPRRNHRRSMRSRSRRTALPQLGHRHGEHERREPSHSDSLTHREVSLDDQRLCPDSPGSRQHYYLARDRPLSGLRVQRQKLC